MNQPASGLGQWTNRHGGDVVILHRLAASRQGRRASPLRPVGRRPAGGRVRVSRLVVGASQSRFASGRIGNRPASKPEVHANRNPKPLGDLREHRVEPEPSTGVRSRRSGRRDARGRPCPPGGTARDRAEGQERLVDLGVGAASDDVGPALRLIASRSRAIDSGSASFACPSTACCRGEEGHGRGASSGSLISARGHCRVEQAEVDDVGVDRVEPLARLGEQLERRAEAVLRAVFTSPAAQASGPGEDFAGQALAVEGCRGDSLRSSRSRTNQQAVPRARKSRARASDDSSPVGSEGASGATRREEVGDQRRAGRSPPSTRAAPTSSAWVR